MTWVDPISGLSLGALLAIPAWLIFRRAGVNPAWSLTTLIPYVGPFVAVAILALSEWRMGSAR